MKQRKSGKKLLALLTCAAMIFCLLPGQAEAKSSSEIREQLNELKNENQELKDKIQNLNDQYQENENEIEELVNQKDLIDQQITLMIDQVENINHQITTYSLLIADKQDELDEAQAHLDELSEKNRERIRTMEEEGSLSYWSVIFAANSFSDLLDRINMVQEIAASDQRRLTQLREASEEVAAAQAELTSEKQELELSREELAQTEAELDEKREEADELLRQLIAKGEQFQALIDESEDLQDQLMQEIAQAEKDLKAAEYQEWLATYVPPTTWPSDDTTPSTGVPASSGWMCPVPYYSLTSAFGMRIHPISGVWKMHNGVDMSCAQGTPIYASRSGKVTVASYQAGGAGNYVSINHGDGFSSVYMHMTHYIVSVGQYVTQGQVIGYVGSTGGSTGPHLHFGISYNGSYVNPMQYVK